MLRLERVGKMHLEHSVKTMHFSGFRSSNFVDSTYGDGGGGKMHKGYRICRRLPNLNACRWLCRVSTRPPHSVRC